jgi:hypothetical protein
MSAPEAVLSEHGIRIAREIPIGEEQQLDVRDEVIAIGLTVAGLRRSGVGALGRAPAAGSVSSYVSHVDIFEAD